MNPPLRVIKAVLAVFDNIPNWQVTFYNHEEWYVERWYGPGHYFQFGTFYGDEEVCSGWITEFGSETAWFCDTFNPCEIIEKLLIQEKEYRDSEQFLKNSE